MTTEPVHVALEYAHSREAAGRLRMPRRKSSGAFGFIGYKKSPRQLERNQGLAKGGHDEAVKNVMPVRTQGHS